MESHDRIPYVTVNAQGVVTLDMAIISLHKAPTSGLASLHQQPNNCLPTPT